VAISRSRLLTIVVCSTPLFEIAPDNTGRLDDGPVWARLFTQTVGRDAEPAWVGSLSEFVGDVQRGLYVCDKCGLVTIPT
jgi:hypothetical protein